MKILLVEDELPLAQQVQAELHAEGFTVDHSANGEDGHFMGANERYDAIVLDLGLPIMDGVSVLRAWREAGITTPVLILTARGSWQDRVDGLNAGGDDYLAKPFHMEELVARMRALIRRSAGVAAATLNHDEVTLNLQTGRAYQAKQPLSLTAHELKLLTALMLRPEKVHSKEELSEKIYGYHDERDSNTMEVFIARLRQKLGSRFIRTIRGRGYTLSGQ